MQIETRLKQLNEKVNTRLDELLQKHCDEGVLQDAMRYSLMAGGKRLRPALCMMSASMFGDEDKALDIACAMEMIHTYSLIHDDLPAMDDDNMRRGKPTNHVVFGEAYAILAGDGLLNLAFEVMLQSALENAGSGLYYNEAMHIIASASGVRGMVGGQVADMMFEGKDKDEEVLRYIHSRKTAALIKASIMSGAILIGVSEDDIGALAEYGDCIGIVFQIVDDILDVTGDPEKVGKTLGKDSQTDKQTFAGLYGVERSRQIAAEKTQQAIDALTRFEDRAADLAALAVMLRDRDR